MMYKKKKKYRSDIRSFEEIKFKKLEKFISKDGKLKFLNYQRQDVHSMLILLYDSHSYFCQRIIKIGKIRKEFCLEVMMKCKKKIRNFSYFKL